MAKPGAGLDRRHRAGPEFFSGSAAADLKLRTGFAFPILVGETCTGVMSFYTREDLALDQPLLDMMAAVGQEIGQFLQRTRAEELLRTRIGQRAAVAELGQAALAGGVLPDLMDRATRLVAETLEVELCKILELLPGGRELLLKAGIGWRPGQVGRRKVGAARRSQAGYTLSVAEPVIVRDLRTETRFRAPPLLREHCAVSGSAENHRARIVEKTGARSLAELVRISLSAGTAGPNQAVSGEGAVWRPE